MEKGHVLQSLPMQQMIVGSCPNWWNMNNMTRPPLNYHQQLPTPSTNTLIPPNSVFIPQQMPPSSSSSSSSCHDNQDQLPQSWSQLLLGGGVMSEEDKSGKLENWEEQILQHHSPNNFIKQDNSARGYVYGHGEIDRNYHHDQYQAATMASWSQVENVSSPKSSSTANACNLSTNMLDFSNKKKDAKRSPPNDSSECISTATGGALKKARAQLSSFQSTIKVRKEKLGDRVTALHQLVSPFGKTDTASVLLEAIGYIRFLENQVEALSLPYLSNGGANKKLQHSVNVDNNNLFLEDPGQLLNDNSVRIKGAPPPVKDSNEEPKKDLRSRGLCLVPLSCTLRVGSEISADYWAPSLGGGFR